ncbi:MAG: hypothetical protein P1V36_00135 [Planctomycetota bacterium]|nr:hypothetical protein [Planctomycetota bacterium]
MKPGMDAAKKLKDFRAKKMKKDEPEDEPAEESGEESGESVEEAVEELPAESDEGVDEAPEAEIPSEEGEGSDDEGSEEEGAKLFADKLFDGDEMTGQAVYAEAMSMPEYAEMSAEDIAKKLDGNYDALKAIMLSMGQKAASAMKEAMNAPAEMPEDPSGA